MTLKPESPDHSGDLPDHSSDSRKIADHGDCPLTDKELLYHFISLSLIRVIFCLTTPAPSLYHEINEQPLITDCLTFKRLNILETSECQL